jgi:hypothetical protein
MRLKLNPLASAITALTLVYSANVSAQLSGLVSAPGGGGVINGLAKPVVDRLRQGNISIAEIPGDGVTLTTLSELSGKVSVGLDPTWLVKSVTLSGGPSGLSGTELDVRQSLLGAMLQGYKNFAVEMPDTLYPSSSTPYTISILAKDRMGNASELTRTFFYMPEELPILYVDSGELSFPFEGIRIPEALVVKDVPSARINSVFIESSPNSSATIEVNGRAIRPGSRVKVASNYMPGKTGGDLVMDMAIHGSGGADFYVDMGPGLPIAKASAVVANSGVSSAVSSTSPRLMDRFTMTVTASGCNLVDAESATASTTQELMTGTANCAIEWMTAHNFDETEDPALKTTQVVSMDSLYLGYKVSYKLDSGKEHIVDVDSAEISPRDKQVNILPIAEPVSAPIRIETFNLPILAGANDCDLVAFDVIAPVAGSCVVRSASGPVDLALSSTQNGDIIYTGTLSDLGLNQFTFELGQVSEAGRVVWFPSVYTAEVLGTDPDAPTVNFGGVLLDGEENTYKAYLPKTPGDTVEFLTASSSTQYPVDVDFTGDDVIQSQSFKNVAPGDVLKLTSSALELWQTDAITVKTAYSDYPEKFSSQTVKILQLPARGVELKVSGPEKAFDLNPYPIEIDFGIDSGDGTLDFAEPTMGNWDIEFGVLEDEQFVSFVEDFDPATGVVKKSLDPAQLKRFVDQGSLVVRATIDTPDPRFERTITKVITPPDIKPILPVAATLSPSDRVGQEPLQASFTATLSAETADQLDSITWETSADGTTWTVVPNQDNETYTKTYNSGIFKVRAKLTNKFAEDKNIAAFTTEPATVYVYENYGMSITSDEFVFPGDDLVMTAAATPRGGDTQAPDNIETTWSYVSGATGELVTATGDSFNFNEAKTGNYIVTAIGRPAGITADQFPGIAQTATVTVGNPSRLKIGVSGSGGAEVGRENPYSASIAGPWRSKSHGYKVVQKWTVPVAGEIESSAINFKPTEDMLIDSGDVESYVDLVHQSWVEGYKSLTFKEFVKTVRVWKYEWPDFDISFKSQYQAVPSTVTVQFKPKDSYWYRRTYKDPINYEFSVPEGVEIVEQSGQRLIVKIAEPGDLLFSARASDDLGNNVSGEEAFSLAPTPPYNVSLNATASNRYNRVPFHVTGRLSVTGGHPQDNFESVSWSLDGQSYPEFNGNTSPQIQVTEAGEHELVATVTSVLGTSTEASNSITAVNNQLPTCEVTYTPLGSNMTATAKCPDPDGFISTYQWFVNGVEASLTSYRITFTPKASGNTIVMTATDDSGGQVTVQDSF